MDSTIHRRHPTSAIELIGLADSGSHSILLASHQHSTASHQRNLKFGLASRPERCRLEQQNHHRGHRLLSVATAGFILRVATVKLNSKDILSKDFRVIRCEAFPDDERKISDLRRSGAVEAVTGGVNPPTYRPRWRTASLPRNTSKRPTCPSWSILSGRRMVPA